MFSQYYYIYLADTMTIGEIEYYIAEFFGKVVCRSGHTYLLIPMDGDDEGLYDYEFIF